VDEQEMIEPETEPAMRAAALVKDETWSPVSSPQRKSRRVLHPDGFEESLAVDRWPSLVRTAVTLFAAMPDDCRRRRVILL
jgi:hypothetical protein